MNKRNGYRRYYDFMQRQDMQLLQQLSGKIDLTEDVRDALVSREAGMPGATEAEEQSLLAADPLYADAYAAAECAEHVGRCIPGDAEDETDMG